MGCQIAFSNFAAVWGCTLHKQHINAQQLLFVVSSCKSKMHCFSMNASKEESSSRACKTPLLPLPSSKKCKASGISNGNAESYSIACNGVSSFELVIPSTSIFLHIPPGDHFSVDFHTIINNIWWCGLERVFSLVKTENERPEAVFTAITKKICSSIWVLGNMTLSIDYKTVFKSLLAVIFSTDDFHILFQSYYSAKKFSVSPRSST